MYFISLPSFFFPLFISSCLFIINKMPVDKYSQHSRSLDLVFLYVCGSSHCEEKASLKFLLGLGWLQNHDAPASVSHMLGLQLCTTTNRLNTWDFNFQKWADFQVWWSKVKSAKANVYVRMKAISTIWGTRNELECEQNYFNFLSCSFVKGKIVIIIALAHSILRWNKMIEVIVFPPKFSSYACKLVIFPCQQILNVWHLHSMFQVCKIIILSERLRIQINFLLEIFHILLKIF